jgi:hypothetical protein
VPILVATTPILPVTVNGETVPVPVDGRLAVLTWDLSQNQYASTTTIKRKVMNPSGTQTLNDYINVRTVSYPAGQPLSKFGSFIDTSANFDPSGNFLNGNRVFYQIDVSFDVPGSADVVYTGINANLGLPIQYIVPVGAPIPTDSSGNPINLATDASSIFYPLNPDSSGNFTQAIAFINKNGGDINNLVYVTLSEDGTQTFVETLTNPVINYNNIQVNGKIAANQFGSYTFNSGTTEALSALLVATNPIGAYVPKLGTQFGPNI